MRFKTSLCINLNSLGPEIILDMEFDFGFEFGSLNFRNKTWQEILICRCNRKKIENHEYTISANSAKLESILKNEGGSRLNGLMKKH